MRKRRTREHIIADLSVNHVERHALLVGYTVDRNLPDYGIDLTLTTYNDYGEIEDGQVMFQLKATDALRVSADGEAVLFSLERSDLMFWLRQTFPFVLVIYDAQADVAYWLYVQAYFEQLPDFELSQRNRTVAVRVPVSNIVNATAMRAFARFRDSISQQTLQVTHYDNQNSANGES